MAFEIVAQLRPLTNYEMYGAFTFYFVKNDYSCNCWVHCLF